jgi:hypothetical protein
VAALSNFGGNGGNAGVGVVEAYPQADVNQENRNPQSAKSGILQKWVSKTCKPVNSMVL